MKKIVYILVTILNLNTLYISAQSDALYSQYMFNQFTINPAYAGSRDALSTVLLYRSQWTGLEDAPKTVNVSAHSPFHRKNMALGVNFMMDEGQDRIKTTYSDNYDRLARIKQQYDPENFFRVNQNIQPAAADESKVAAGGS